MGIHNTKCLLLNLDYTPMTIIGWQRALVWSIKHEYNSKYGIEIIDFYKNDFIQGTGNKKYPVPAVAKTKKFFKKQQPVQNAIEKRAIEPQNKRICRLKIFHVCQIRHTNTCLLVICCLK